jgi:hypothetical protein
MKRQLLALTLALSALLPMSSRADTEVSFQFFYDNLSPHGEWLEVGDYGNCWRPHDVDDDWAPYTDGYWSYTDAGWTWVSYEDFGDITYHYGRWVRADDVGWCWVPDNEWGPAWVSWRSDDDYIGWAPLPPEATWSSNAGFSVWVDDYYDIGPSYYNFCPIVEFSAPVIRYVCVPRVNIVNIYSRCVNITNISFNRHHGVPFCGGPNFNFINGRVRRPVPALKLVQNTTIINNNYTVINNRRVLKAPRNNVAGNTLNVFAPKVIKNGDNLIKPQVTKVVAKDKVRRGWDLVKDQGEAKQLREKVKNQAKGLNPETAPAKPVQTADLKPLPEKADPQGPSPVARPNGPRKDRDGDGIPDRKDKEIAGQPDRPGKEKPGRPDANQPGADRPGVAEARPGKGQGGKGNKDDGQPDTPTAGVTPDQPDAPDRPGKAGRPNRIAGEQPGPTDDQLNRRGQGQGQGQGGGLRKPFKQDGPDNRIADDRTPERPSTEAPEREPAAGKGKARRGQDADEQIERQQRRQIADQQLERQQQQQQQAARMEQQRENAQRLERQREAQQQQAARQQQAEVQARRQQMQQQEAVQQQRQQQRAIENQRQQQMQRQLEMQQQRQQQMRQQPRPERAQMPPPQQQRIQQVPQRQIQNPNVGGGGGGGGGGGRRQLSPEEAQALRRGQR